ncbi:MAG: hypothetical protein WD733_12500 [Bryobacterales bacterium]
MVEWATVRYSTGDFWVVGLLTPNQKSTPKDTAARFRGRLETPEVEEVHEGGGLAPAADLPATLRHRGFSKAAELF